MAAQTAGEVDTTFNLSDAGYSLEAGFGETQYVPMSFIMEQPNGDLILGEAAWFNGQGQDALCRLHADGTIDTSFHYSGAIPHSYCMLDDGSYFLLTYSSVSKYHADGSQDLSFTPGSITSAGGSFGEGIVFVPTDSSIVVCGKFTAYNGQDVPGYGHIMKLDMTGVIVQGWPAASFLAYRLDEVTRVGADGFLALQTVDDVDIIILNADGSVNETLDPHVNAFNGDLNAWLRTDLIDLPNGRKFIYSITGEYEYQDVTGILLLDSAMNMDTSMSNAFQADLNGLGGSDLYSPRVAADQQGRIYIYGPCSNASAVLDSCITILRILPDGTVDPTFSSLGLFTRDFPPNISALKVLQSGKILATGYMEVGKHGSYRNGAILLDSTGRLDPTFMATTGFNGPVRVIEQQANGKYIVSGEFTSYFGAPCRYLARLEDDGTLDTTFSVGRGPDGWASDIAVQEDDKILIAGEITRYDDQVVHDFFRLNTDGTLDTAFNPFDPVSSGYENLSSDFPTALTLQPDGRILIAGNLQWSNTGQRDIARYYPDGTRDITLGGSSDGMLEDVALQPDGKLICVGDFTQWAGGPSEDNCVRVSASGSLDAAFNIPGSATYNFDVMRAFVRTDGDIYVLGHFSLIGTFHTEGIGRLNPDGSPDVSFSNVDGNIYFAGALQGDDKLLFSTKNYDDLPQQGIARLNANGTLDLTFGAPDTTLTGDESISAIFIDNQDRIIVGGSFGHMRGHGRNGIARLLNDFSTSTASAPCATGTLNCYPNPSQGRTFFRPPTLDGAATRILGLTCRDELGREVGTLPYTLHGDGTVELDLGALEPALYTVRIHSTAGVHTAVVALLGH